MTIVASILVALVAIEHFYILWLEMFRWQQPGTRRAFGLSKELAQETVAMAANQGLYNGFLAVGLVWGLIHPNAAFGFQVQLFFVCCVMVAAVYGAISVKRSILVMQGLPAALAFLALVLPVLFSF